MEFDMLGVQDDWSHPNVQIEIELQPILESAPTFSDICIQPGSVQTDAANKKIASYDHVSQKTFCVEFTPKVRQPAVGNKHLLIEFMPKHNDGNNIEGYYKQNKTFNKTVAEQMRSVSNGIRRLKRNSKNNTIINYDEAENQIIEVDVPTPINSFNVVTEKSNNNIEIIDSANENQDVENLLPIYMTAKFKDSEFPSYPVIEKVESLADVSICNVELENAITPVEKPAVQVDKEIATLWLNQHYKRVEKNCSANKALRHGTRRSEPASILENILKSPACAVLEPIQNQMLKPIQAMDVAILNPNNNLMTPVPMITIEARTSPVRTMTPPLPTASHLPEVPPATTPVIITDGKSTLRADTYNSLLSRMKILNLSKPLPRPKNNSKIPRRIRRVFKDVFKKNCLVSLPRILLYQCKDCSAARTSMFDLVRHLCLARKTKKTHYQKKLTGKNAKEIFYKCGNCFKYYITKQHLMNHIQLEHPGIQTLSHTVCCDIADDLYQCNLCDIEYKDEKLLLDHYRATHIVMHKCPFCPSEAFISRDLLITHFFESHRHVTSLYRCGLPDCFIYFTEYKDLIEHSSLAHGQPILKCILCDTEFPDKHILLQHILTVHNKTNHVCEECHLHFPTINLLLAHMAVPQSERHAADMTRFLLQCRRCGRYFIKTIDNKAWPPKNSFLEPVLCISCLIPSETTLTVKSDNNDTIEVLDTN